MVNSLINAQRCKNGAKKVYEMFAEPDLTKIMAIIIINHITNPAGVFSV
jgi:hypothetical protein